MNPQPSNCGGRDLPLDQTASLKLQDSSCPFTHFSKSGNFLNFWYLKNSNFKKKCFPPNYPLIAVNHSELGRYTGTLFQKEVFNMQECTNHCLACNEQEWGISHKSLCGFSLKNCLGIFVHWF